MQVKSPPPVKYNPNVEALNSPLDAGSSNLNYLKKLYFSEMGASRVNQLMPITNPLAMEALSSLSNSLCLASKVENLEEFSPSALLLSATAQPQHSHHSHSWCTVEFSKQNQEQFQAVQPQPSHNTATTQLGQTEPKIQIGYTLSNTQGELSNISNNVESEEPAEFKSKYCSSAAQQSEETMESKKPRAPKVISSRIYRARVAEAIKALKNALPYSEMGNQASILDNVIDYIKFLKLRLNVLSQTRLTGEASAHSFVHIEGFGHYLLHPQTCHQPVEEMVGHLLKSNPQAADELLEHKGLAIVPMDSAYTVLHHTLKPCSSSCQS